MYLFESDEGSLTSGIATNPRIASLLMSVGARRAAVIRANRVYGERLSPDFGVFRFVDTSEAGISRVLAWLLDPAADHAQGSRFLGAFWRWLGIDWDDAWAPHTTVRTEAPVPRNVATRFIDVLVTTPTMAVAIENKIGARDQLNQVRDYLAFMSKCRSAYLLLYLSPDGSSPSQMSLDAAEARRARASGALAERSYSALIDFLTDCADSCRSQRVTYFIEDFVRHISQSILGIEDMEDSTELAAEIASDDGKLAAALEIFEAERHLKSRLMRGAQEEIIARCQSEGWVLEGDIASGEAGDYLLVLFRPDDVWGIGISFYRSGYRTMFYGLARRDDCDARRRIRPEVLSLLNDVHKGRGDADWPWWLNAKPHNHYFPFPEDWAGTKDFWLAVSKGVFAAKFLHFVVGIKSHLENAKMMPLLR